MKELPIKRNLNEYTEKQSVWIIIDGKPEVFALHITDHPDHKEVIITDHSDYTKIYRIESLDFYNARMKG